MRAARLLPLAVLAVLLAWAPAARAASAEVAALQVALGGAGLYAAGVDGVTGPATQRAVQLLQRRAGLPADGVAGPRTRAALGRRGRPALGSRPMRLGHEGWDVASLQFLLRERGFDPGRLDGGFGRATLGAVRAFQRTTGLAADDVAGPATLAALRNRAVAARITDPVRFLRPVSGPITDRFGWVGMRRHTGIDFPRGHGAPVGAAGRGVVVFASMNRGGYGNLVVVRHRLGFESWYAHLATIAVRPGQAVVGGTPIGTVGSTGRSTGPHLHFEVRRHGTPIDPVARMLTVTAAGRRSSSGRRRRLVCRPNADARRTRDADPARARIDRCP